MGYTIYVKTLCAADFGVPQIRERVFIIGIRKDLSIEWEFPVGRSKRITIEEAISDLPIVGEGEIKTEYDKQPSTKYQFIMRNGSKERGFHHADFSRFSAWRQFGRLALPVRRHHRRAF